MERNRSILNETILTQQKTKEALERIQRQAAETEVIGQTTLASLHENDQRIDQISKESKKLKEKLKQTDKLQNHLSKWSLQLQNRRGGRKLAKKEQKEEKMVTKEQDIKVAPSKMASVSSSSNKLEIFSGRTRRDTQEGTSVATTLNSCSVPGHKKEQGEPTQVSDTDRLLLDQIDQQDKDLDPSLDILGLQMENLLAISTSLGEASETRNAKLDAAEEDLQKADYKQKVANQRNLLFTMTPRQKRAEKKLDTRIVRASKLNSISPEFGFVHTSS